MQHRGRSRRWLALGAFGATAALALPTFAVAQQSGISLGRTPSPPQAVQAGSGSQQLDWNVTFGSTPDRVVANVYQPNSSSAFQTTTTIISGQPSPQAGSFSFSPPANAILGRYTGEVQYFSLSGLEASARVTFDVADQLGTLVVTKYEDDNGNGVRDPFEPAIPGWRFLLTNPQNNASEVITGTDGSTTIADVPAGTWGVQEFLDPEWVAISPPGGAGTVNVPPNGTGTFLAGNARPAPISGTVFFDNNRNGVLDPGEPPVPNVTLTLGGTTGLGAAVPAATTTSAVDGTYLFDRNLPGTYSVTMTVPPRAEATSPTELTDIVVRSNVGSPNNNFGINRPSSNAPGGRTAGGPTPDVRIGKGGPAPSRRGAIFGYTIVVRNRSEFTARNVEVTDLVPRQLALVRIPRGATIRNGVVTWSVGDLRAGQSRRLTMAVRVISGTASTRIVNTATVTADGLPPRRDRATTTLVGPQPVARTGGVTG